VEIAARPGGVLDLSTKTSSRSLELRPAPANAARKAETRGTPLGMTALFIA